MVLIGDETGIVDLTKKRTAGMRGIKREGGAGGRSMSETAMSEAPPCFLWDAAYLDEPPAAARMTRCVEEFSTGSVCTTGLA